jgi:hypothetical protein
VSNHAVSYIEDCAYKIDSVQGRRRDETAVAICAATIGLDPQALTATVPVVMISTGLGEFGLFGPEVIDQTIAALVAARDRAFIECGLTIEEDR